MIDSDMPVISPMLSLLIILLEVWSVARKYAFNPPKIRFPPDFFFTDFALPPNHIIQTYAIVTLRSDQSLLIILLEVWSMARKYAFNPPKIRFPPDFFLPILPFLQIT
jgi:hypothetical protein